jgi:predicted metal-dependent hydrolase
VKDSFKLAEFEVEVSFKDIKNVHLSVKPPNGRVEMTAPIGTRPTAIMAYATSKLGWIREKRARLAKQRRETRRQYVSRESHMLWGKRYLLKVVESDERPQVHINHRELTLLVRRGSTRERRREFIEAWHRELLHTEVPSLISKWEKKLAVKVESYALQRMRTRWGSCNRVMRRIRINTELVKKPKELLEYVVIHEMLHLRISTHSEQFVELLTRHYPAWRQARAELNALPLSATE